MPGPWIHRKLYIPIAFLERLHHRLCLHYWHHPIPGSMKSPDGQMFDSTYPVWVATPTNGGNRGKPVRILNCQSPGAKTSHTQTSDIDAISINSILAHRLIQN